MTSKPLLIKSIIKAAKMSRPISSAFGSSQSSSTSATPRPEQRLIQDVLEGTLRLDHVPVSNTMRLFISSDLSDTQIELAALRKQVYPALQSHANTLGLQLHIVDPFHCIESCNKAGNSDEDNGEEGVEENSLLPYKLEEEGVFQLTVKEIDLCHQLSAGVAYVTLLSQKYGHRPLQRCVPEAHFPQLCSVIEDQEHRYLVKQSYRLDNNAYPPEYILQCTNTNSSEWPKIHDALFRALGKAAKVVLGKEPSKVQSYIASATEDEVTHGIFNSKMDPNNKCLWFKRTFTDLYNQWLGGDTAALSQYSDVGQGKRGLEFDQDSLKALNYLKEARMTAKYIGLDASNIFDFPLQWQKGKGLDPENNPSHEQYIASLCEVVRTSLIERLNQTATEIAMKIEQTTDVYQEALLHVQHCKAISKDTMDYSNLLPRIRDYLEGNSNSPLVVYGSTGAGKSTAVSSAIQQLMERTGGIQQAKKVVIVSRFVGLTPTSCSIKKMLNSICKQIASVFKCTLSIPADYRGVSACFSDLLTKVPSTKHLCLFIDGVDQLSPQDGALGLSWLPLSLPSHVKVVISTSSETHYRCYPVLRSLLSTNECFLEVPPLTEESGKFLLNHFLSLSNRQLTPAQTDMVLLAVKQCPIPTYLKLVTQEAAKWRSFDTRIDDSILQAKDLKEVVMRKLDALEKQHGPLLVGHTLGGIAAARFGLTEPEILDLLSLDKEVLEELNSSSKMLIPFVTPLREVPPALWSRLLHDLLKVFIKFSVGDGGFMILRCDGRYIEEAVTERYLHNTTARLAIYNGLASYFSGIEPEAAPTATSPLSVSSEPVTPSFREINRQPLILNAKRQLYNTRKLLELPHSLSRAHRFQELQVLLADYEWLRACNSTGSLDETITEFSSLVPAVPIGSQRSEVMTELRLLNEALQLSLNTLSEDSTQLSQQLIGRLLPYISDGKNDKSILMKLVTEALESNCPVLVPQTPLSCVPGGPLLLTMAGHRDSVTSVAAVVIPLPHDDKEEKEPSSAGTSADCQMTIISGSVDMSLRTWDWQGSGVLKTFDGHSKQVSSVALSKDGKFAASGARDKVVRYWEVSSGTCLHAMEGHKADVTAVVLSSDGSRTVSSSLDTTIKVWNTNQTSRCKGELIYTLSTGHKSPVLCLALSEDDRCLVVGKAGGTVVLADVVSGEIVHSKQAHQAAPVTALAVAKLDDNSVRIVTGSMDCFLKVWDAELTQCLHSMTTSAPVTSITLGSNGRLVSAHNTRSASVWDIYSGEHQFDLTRPTTSIVSVFTIDQGRLVVSGNSDATLNIWDLTSPPLSSDRNEHAPANSLAISPCGNFFLSASVQEKSVFVHNIENISVVRSFANMSSSITCLLALRDSQHFLTGHENGSISLCNGDSESILMEMTGHKSKVTSLSVSLDSKLVMSGGEDGQVIVWSLQKGSKLKVLNNHKTAIIAVHFSRGYIISADKSGTVCVRDFTTAKTITLATPYAKELTHLEMSADTSALIAGYSDASLVTLKLPNLTSLSMLMNHKASSVVALPHNKCLTSAECTLKLWDLATFELEASFMVDSQVTAATVHPRTKTIVYGCEDGSISKCWYGGEQESKKLILKKLIRVDPVSTASSSQATSLASSSSALSSDKAQEKEEVEDSTSTKENDQNSLNKDKNEDETAVKNENKMTHSNTKLESDEEEHSHHSLKATESSNQEIREVSMGKQTEQSSKTCTIV